MEAAPEWVLSLPMTCLLYTSHHNDLFETRAIKLAFGEHAYDMKINSTKSMVGHLLGAAGAVEFVTCVKEIQEGYIHRTVGLRETEEELDLSLIHIFYLPRLSLPPE